MRDKFNPNLYIAEPEDNTTSSLTSTENRSLNLGFSPINFRFNSRGIKPSPNLKGLLSTKSLSKDDELKMFGSYMSNTRQYKQVKISDSVKIPCKLGHTLATGRGIINSKNKDLIEINQFQGYRYKLNNFINGNIYKKSEFDSSSSLDGKGYMNSNSGIYNRMANSHHTKKN